MWRELVNNVLTAADAAGIEDRRELVELALRHFFGVLRRIDEAASAATASSSAPSSANHAASLSSPNLADDVGTTRNGDEASGASRPLPNDSVEAAFSLLAAATESSQRRPRKTPLAALGSTFFDRSRFGGGAHSINAYLDSFTPRERGLLWAPPGGPDKRSAAVGHEHAIAAAADSGAADAAGATAAATASMLAIYPGSFNPPTRAHQAIAAAVAAMPDVRALWMDLTTPCVGALPSRRGFAAFVWSGGDAG